MKQFLSFLIFSFGGVVTSRLFGVWNGNMTTLAIFCLLDFATGLLLAFAFKKSTKTKSGKLSSSECVKGITRKVIIFVIICVAYRVQLILAITYLRDGVVIGFIVSEGISILENTGRMGIKSELLEKALDNVKQKGGLTK